MWEFFEYTCILIPVTIIYSRCNEERLVPFRESKLTQLFQNYFVGKGEEIRRGKIAMFVNVSNNASVFDETFHVLKFSALTSKVGIICLFVCVSLSKLYVCMQSMALFSHAVTYIYVCLVRLCLSPRLCQSLLCVHHPLLMSKPLPLLSKCNRQF